MTAVALVPGVLALLPEHASLEDPVADLRSACGEAVAALGPRVRVVAATGSGERVGRSLVDAAGAEVVADGSATGVLVVANGSATRTEKAPGHLDDRAEAFDAALGAGLRAGDAAALRAVDRGLAAELWADVGALDVLAGLLEEGTARGSEVRVLYDDAPFGVQYWVLVCRPTDRS